MTMPGEQYPPGVRDLAEEFDLDPPEPGEVWAFDLEDPPGENKTPWAREGNARSVRERLTAAGCELEQEFVTGGGGRHYEYRLPEPGWPDPFGYVTSSPAEWVTAQHGWSRQGAFYGRVAGSIPDPGDCDRHPDLPPDAYALTAVHVTTPGREAKYHSKASLERPDDKWTVQLVYEQANRSHSSKVYVYNEEQLGAFPHVTWWRSSPHTRTERRRVEFVGSFGEARLTVRSLTGLDVPEPPEVADG